MARNGEAMPRHQYVPDPRIPGWLNRLLAHPFENAVAVVALFFGITLFIVAVSDEVVPSKALDNLSFGLSALMGVTAFFGAAGTLIGAHWWGENLGKGWIIERSGLAGLSSFYLVYGVSVVYSFPDSWFSWLQPIILGGACAVRVIALTLTKRWIRRAKEGSQ